ncbi:MAG: hypothetical protein AAB436_03120 [Patescibacteria group bacterium]
MVDRLDGSGSEGFPSGDANDGLPHIEAHPDGGFVASSPDGLQVLTPSSTPDEAVEDLSIARFLDKKFGIPDLSSEVELDVAISELGFDPQDFQIDSNAQV